MRHPNQATLALYAGGDLGWIARWRTERHLAGCERCRDEVAAFDEIREILPGLAETPEIPWNRLAAEMKANIRLGLAAGECVRSETPLRESPWFTGVRAVVAFASVIALVVAGLALQRPAPPEDGIVVQANSRGIQVREGRQSLSLLNTGAREVTYTVGAQGSMRARYVDPETGYVTINCVNAE